MAIQKTRSLETAGGALRGKETGVPRERAFLPISATRSARPTQPPKTPSRRSNPNKGSATAIRSRRNRVNSGGWTPRFDSTGGNIVNTFQ